MLFGDFVLFVNKVIKCGNKDNKIAKVIKLLTKFLTLVTKLLNLVLKLSKRHFFLTKIKNIGSLYTIALVFLYTLRT